MHLMIPQFVLKNSLIFCLMPVFHSAITLFLRLGFSCLQFLLQYFLLYKWLCNSFSCYLKMFTKGVYFFRIVLKVSMIVFPLSSIYCRNNDNAKWIKCFLWLMPLFMTMIYLFIHKKNLPLSFLYQIAYSTCMYIDGHEFYICNIVLQGKIIGNQVCPMNKKLFWIRIKADCFSWFNDNCMGDKCPLRIASTRNKQRNFFSKI